MSEFSLNANVVHSIIGQNVKKYRKLKRMSQLNLSLSLGYSSISLVSMSETGARNKHFNVIHLIKIARILEVDVGVFFEGVDKVICKN